jgi:hypothetical protein
MSHKYLPRPSRRVLPLAAVTLAAACGDPAGPAVPAPRLALAADAPAADSLARLAVGVDLAMRDSVPFRDVAVWVDSAAAPAPQSTDRLPIADHRWSVVAYVPGPGRHTITVAVTDTAGRVTSASLALAFRLPEVAYTAAALPDLGHGGAATFVHAGGDVAGWVATAAGRRRPAVWRRGALELVPAPDSVDVVATHLNAAGDVLLRFGNPGYVPQGPHVRVRRADGALLVVGPLRTEIPNNGLVDVCCTTAADLNERRQAVAAAPLTFLVPYRTAVLDVASGRIVDSARAVVAAVNDRGLMVGTAGLRSGYNSTSLEAVGFAPPPRPEGAARWRCDPRVGRFTHETALALDNAGNVLSDYCGNLALRSTAGSVWLDRFLGRARVARLSRDGGLVVGLDSAGALTRWSLAARRPERLRVAGDPWHVDSLGAVNASGQIAAEGVDRASGRRAALLLTPAPR